jgi:hypothetical protein
MSCERMLEHLKVTPVSNIMGNFEDGDGLVPGPMSPQDAHELMAADEMRAPSPEPTGEESAA